MILTVWIACSAWLRPTVSELAEGGIRVELPAGFVALESEALAEQRAFAETSAPRQVHTLAAARRGSKGAAGLVQLQHSVDPDAGQYGNTVAEVLAAVEAEVGHPDAQRAQSSEAAPRDGGHEVCATATTDGMVVRTCALVTVDPSRRLHVRAITCTAPDAVICELPLASRRYQPGEVLPLSAVLVEPTALPRRGTQLWGFTFGSSRAAFRVACAAAGHAVDRYDWAVEAPVVRAWFDDGRASRCEGTPIPPRIGPVTAVSATFHDDQLAGLTVFVAADAAAVEARLTERYPVSVAGEGQILFVVDAEATADQLQSVTLFGGPGAPTTLSFLSERGAVNL